MEKDNDRQERLFQMISEISKWTKFIGKQELRKILLDTLKEDFEKIIYELSDGKSLRTISEICKKNGFSVGKDAINTYWDKWVCLGIVEPSVKYKGRFERIVSLKEVGLEVPKFNLEKTIGCKVKK